MCEPTTMAATTLAKLQMATAAASTLMSLTAQKNAAKAQGAAQAAAARRENARYQREATAQRLKEAQQDLALANEIKEASRKSKEARATAVVSAGESGVSGLSVDALIDDYTRQEAEHRFTLNEQARLTGINNQLQLQEAGFRNQDNLIRINKPIQKPDYLGSAVNLAGSYLQIQGNLKQNEYTEAKIKSLNTD